MRDPAKALDALRDLAAGLEATATELAHEYAARLQALPAPGSDLRSMLAALGQAEHDTASYLATSWDVQPHRHLECQPRDWEAGEEFCARCLEWSRICGEKDRAIDALTRYALALEEKRAVEAGDGCQCGNECGRLGCPECQQ